MYVYSVPKGHLQQWEMGAVESTEASEEPGTGVPPTVVPVVSRPTRTRFTSARFTAVPKPHRGNGRRRGRHRRLPRSDPVQPVSKAEPQVATSPSLPPPPPPPREPDTEAYSTDPGVDTDTPSSLVSAFPGSTLLDIQALTCLDKAKQTRNFGIDEQSGLRTMLRLQSAGLRERAVALLMSKAVVIKTSNADMGETERQVAECMPRDQPSPFVECIEMRSAVGATCDPTDLVYMEGIVTSTETPHVVYFLPWVYDMRKGQVLDCARVRGTKTPHAHTLTYLGIPIRVTRELTSNPQFAHGGALTCVECAA